jgi:hypothetical protein
MAAITALQIAENPLVDDITDFAAGYRSGRTAEQTTEDCSGQTTEQHAGRSADSTYGCASLCAGQSTTSTGCGTTDRADRAADPSGGMQAMDVG